MRWLFLLLMILAPVSADELTLPDAMRAALRDNPELRATLAETGISQADVITASTLSNPIVGLSVRFPGQSGETVDTDYAISFDFLDLVLRPVRKRIAGIALEQAQARVSEAVLRLTTQVEQGWYDAAAAQQVLGQEQIVLDASEAASDLAQRQFDAGNLSELDLNRQKAETAEIQVAMARLQADSKLAQAHLATLLGRSPDQPVAASGAVPELPAQDPAVKLARPLLQEARLETQRLEQEVALAHQEAGLGEIRAGIDRENEADGITVTGPTLQIGLPIFNHRQGDVEALQARLAQSRAHLAAVTLQVQEEAQAARTQMAAARQVADLYAKELVPLRQRIMEQSQRHYNMMLLSVYTLLTDRQAEAEAERALVDARRDYWKARAELNRAQGEETHP